MGALSLSITQWSPFATTGRYIVFGATGAMVWIWDQEKIESCLAAQLLPLETAVVPEPLFYSALLDGVRLLKTKEGFDAQVWVGGELLESIGLTSVPTKRQITILQASFPMLDIADLDKQVEASFTEEVWGKNHANKEIKLSQQAWIAIIGVMAVYFISLSWQLLNLGMLMFATGNIKAEVANYKSQIGEVIDAREAAYKDVAIANALNAHLNAIPQTQVLAGVLEKIPRNGTVLERWSYQDGDLSLTLKGKAFDPRYYVQAFESIPFISTVSTQADQTRGQLTIKAKVAVEEMGLSDMKP